MRYSSSGLALARALTRAGVLDNVGTCGPEPRLVLVTGSARPQSRRPRLTRYWTSSKRNFCAVGLADVRRLARVGAGGVVFLSTSRGVLTASECANFGCGGLLLCAAT